MNLQSKKTVHLSMMEIGKALECNPSMMKIGMSMNVTIETKTQTPMLHLGHGSQT